jgi:MYXO-CTERM domain-containing protein
MRWIGGIVAVLSAGTLAVACSAEPPPERAGDPRPAGEVTEAITAACNPDTIGLPCDPDGPAGAKLECEGVCAILTTGLVSCRAATAGSLDGVVCGSTTGVGDAACKRYCSGKTCLASNAPQGAACRPTSKSNPCEGQCNGAGKCENLGGQACAFGRDEQLCGFATCDFSNTSVCLQQYLPRNTLCSDTDACSIGRCTSAGVCLPGPTIGCDDGNSCTDDTCDPNDGGCVGTNNDNNSCTDGNACFTGEHCSAGLCVPGTVEVDCNDQNACTTDSCDPNIGCAHVKKSCDDANACTIDSCDPANADCSHADVVCDDQDPCTEDGCVAATGCVFTPKNCDDQDLCTADSCSAGACGHDLISCDDNNDCTADSCSADAGCAHVAIVGCGDPGSGGAGGEPGAGGSAGDPQTGEAGEPSTGGVPSTGGEPGSAGEPTTAGTAGTAGQTNGGTAGTAGTAGNATAGNATAGTAGNDTAGSSGTAGVTNQGGSAPVGGAADAGGDSSSGGGPRSVDDGGCGCRTAGSTGHQSGALALGLLGAVAWLRRRRAA